MTPLETSQLRLATDAMLLAASASVCICFLWVLFRIRSRIGARVRPMALMCVFIIALSGSQILRSAAGYFPGHMSVNALATFVAAAALTMALAVWAFIPGLAREPTHNELLAANTQLRAERDARLVVVQELRRARDELEDRVKERTRALDLTRRRFEIALQGTGIVVAHQDTDLRYTWMYNPPPPLTGESVIGRLPTEVLPASLAANQENVKRGVIESGEAARFEAIYPTANGPIWYEGRVEPLMVDGKLEGVMTVSIDVTRHMLQERQMREVLRELTHRSKNLLAVVQGMARQSSADATDMRLFIDGFDARVQALSRAHELLVDSKWRGVSLRVVLEREFSLLAGRLHAVRIEGPDVLLSPEAAQNFALAISELSNDMRGGAPNATMDMDVSWRVQDGALRFDWRRTGGDCRSKFDGFGLNLLNRVLPRQIGGHAQLIHAPEACAYTLEGDAALLAPIGQRSLLDRAGAQDRR